MACSRECGQPLLSKRQRVFCQSAALSPLPCTNTMGGVASEAPACFGSVVEQPAARRAAATAGKSAIRGEKRVIMSPGFYWEKDGRTLHECKPVSHAVTKPACASVKITGGIPVSDGVPTSGTQAIAALSAIWYRIC